MYCISHPFTKPQLLLYLDDTMMNGGILFLPQHHQGNDDDGCYDNTSNHKSNNGALIGPHILCEKHLSIKNKTVLCPKSSNTGLKG